MLEIFVIGLCLIMILPGIFIILGLPFIIADMIQTKYLLWKKEHGKLVLKVNYVPHKGER